MRGSGSSGILDDDGLFAFVDAEWVLRTYSSSKLCSIYAKPKRIYLLFFSCLVMIVIKIIQIGGWFCDLTNKSQILNISLPSHSYLSWP